MPTHKVARNATIRDVLGTLSNPVEYVRGVFQNLHEMRRENRRVVVRIGSQGYGSAPHYRVDEQTQREKLFSPGEVEPAYIPLAAFRGSGHKPLVATGDEDILRDEHWSTASSSYEELRELLGEVRGVAKRG